MKKLFYVAVAAVLTAWLSAGCKYFKFTSETVEIVEDTTEIVAEDPSLFDEEIAVEDGQEVWTSFGGTYFFWGDDGAVVVDFPLPQEGGTIKFTFKDGEYEATADETTGRIVAKDSLGHVAFKGYLYNGGNTIKGLFYGKPLVAEGSGD